MGPLVPLGRLVVLRQTIVHLAMVVVEGEVVVVTVVMGAPFP